MLNTNDTPAASRRGLLGNAAAVLMMGSCTPSLAPAATVSPDAELLALCAEFHRHHADALSLPDTGEYSWEGAQAARWAVSDQIEDMRPETAEGHRAKTAIALVLLEEQRGDSGDADVQFVLATLRDMLGRT